MTSRFAPNPNLSRELEQSADMRSAMVRAAEVAADESRRIAPVDTRQYRDSIRVEVTPDGARVVADDEASVYIEFGTEDTPTFAPLRRGAEAAGLHLRAKR